MRCDRGACSNIVFAAEACDPRIALRLGLARYQEARWAAQTGSAPARLTAGPQISFSSAMPTVNERLADHFVKAAGIAGVYADARSAVGAVDAVGIERDRTE